MRHMLWMCVPLKSPSSPIHGIYPFPSVPLPFFHQDLSFPPPIFYIFRIETVLGDLTMDGAERKEGGGTKSIDALVARATGAAASSHPFVCSPPPIGKSDAFASHHTDFLFLFLSFPDLRECVCSVRHENC